MSANHRHARRAHVEHARASPRRRDRGRRWLRAGARRRNRPAAARARGRSRSARSQQADELGAVHLADRAAHELRLPARRTSTASPSSAAAADHHAVVEGAGHAELREVRARCAAPAAAGSRSNAAGVEEHARCARARWRSEKLCGSWRRLTAGARDRRPRAWSRRRLTTAGVAPMSLIDDAEAPPRHGARRSRRSTACQIVAEAARRRVDDDAAVTRPAAGSISTSRLPEPTTPTQRRRERAPSLGVRRERELEGFHQRPSYQLRKRSRRLVEAARRAHQVLASSAPPAGRAWRRAGRCPGPRRGGSRRGRAGSPPCARSRCRPDRRVAGDAADRLLALLVAAAQQQVGDAFLGERCA